MSTVARSLLLGLSIGCLGLLAAILPPLADLEEGFGLAGLYAWRGPRPAPPEVVVVAIDYRSSQVLGLPNKPAKWPRSLHARLVHRLQDLGADAVAFDMIFEEPREGDQDAAFAQACRQAGNVVLFQYLRRDLAAGTSVHLERLVPPVPALADAAALLAPFPLPKMPLRVGEFWLFKTGAGDPATLPLAALLVQTRSRLPHFGRWLEEKAHRADPGATLALPGEDDLDGLSRALRQGLASHPGLADAMLARLAAGDGPPDPGDRALLAAVVAAYGGPASRGLDFHGPPRTITTLPYHEVLQGRVPADALRGKAVFVGFSEQAQSEQKDGFYTVFSQDDGLDMSGVEIAATAYANLVQGRQVTPLEPQARALLLVLWGIGLGLLLLLPAPTLVAVAPGLVLGYLGVAVSAFAQQGLWLPLVIPALVQLPAALASVLVLRHLALRRDRRRIRDAFARYLPGPVVDRLSQDVGDPAGQGEILHGICLATDAEQYTRLAEGLAPEALRNLLNTYYDSLFEPVRRRGGFVSDVVGDAMLAIWAAREAQASRRTQACLAALEIRDAVEDFNARHPGTRMRTRLGLHCGDILLGNIGARDHFEYRAVGDIVNTASRIEGLNKVLGTTILVSREMVDGLADLETLELGHFLLPGKRQPLTLHELVGTRGTLEDAARQRHAMFTDALRHFQDGSWQQAAEGFLQVVTRDDHGPARFYLGLCETYARQPPGEDWTGIVLIDQK